MEDINIKEVNIEYRFIFHVNVFEIGINKNLFSPRIELGTFCTSNKNANHYTTKTYCLLYYFGIRSDNIRK